MTRVERAYRPLTKKQLDLLKHWMVMEGTPAEMLRHPRKYLDRLISLVNRKCLEPVSRMSKHGIIQTKLRITQGGKKELRSS